MPLDIYSLLFLLIVGFVSGLFISICSGTAAGIMIPFLTVFLDHSIHKSIGTSLFIDGLVGITAGLIFFKNKKTKIKSTLPIIVFSIMGAVIGSFFTSSAPETGLNIYIGILLLVFGIVLMYNGVQKNVDFIKSKYSFDFLKKNKTLVFVVGGFLVGLFSGFTGFGGAAFVAVGLIFILDFDLHTAIGTSLLVMFFIATSGTIGHVIRNDFIFDVGLISGMAAITGALAGSLFANKINEDKLGRIIGLLLLTLGILLFFRLLF